MAQSLRGRYLIAGRHLKDPNFFRTVVLLVEHNEAGSMGLVLNRPTAVEVSQALSGHFELPEAHDSVYSGGPVEPQALFLLHDAAEQAGGELPVLPGLFVGANADVFEKIVTTATATGVRYRVFSGCAGWGSGQLEGELARGDWHVAPAETKDIFDADPYAQWEDLITEVASRHPLFPRSDGDHRMN
jgi:putative transcriptional regulator